MFSTTYPKALVVSNIHLVAIFLLWGEIVPDVGQTNVLLTAFGRCINKWFTKSIKNIIKAFEQDLKDYRADPFSYFFHLQPKKVQYWLSGKKIVSYSGLKNPYIMYFYEFKSKEQTA